MSTQPPSPSRFELTQEDLEKPLPPLKTSSSTTDDELQKLSEEICRLDPQLAEIAFSLSLSAKSREEKLAEIHDWARA